VSWWSVCEWVLHRRVGMSEREWCGWGVSGFEWMTNGGGRWTGRAG
jgi:hypothetical protein